MGRKKGMALKRIGNSISNIAGEIGKTVANTSHKVANNISKIDKDKINETRVNVTDNTQKLVEKASSKVKEGANKSTEIVNKVMDVNGDGQVDIEDVIIMGLKVPGICIKRDEFLRSEFMKGYPQEVINDAIHLILLRFYSGNTKVIRICPENEDKKYFGQSWISRRAHLR